MPRGRQAASVALVGIALAAAGSSGGAERRATDAPLCSPRSGQRPCTDAGLATDYRIRISTHCGFESLYFDGRWWRIDPPQPEGRNWIAGTARLLDADELSFRADDGRRYAFAPAPPAFEPPPCY